MYIHCPYLHTDIYGTLEEHQILFIANAHISSMVLPMVLTLSAWTLGSGASSLLGPSCITFWGGEEERASFNVHSHKHLHAHPAADATSRHTCTPGSRCNQQTHMHTRQQMQPSDTHAHNQLHIRTLHWSHVYAVVHTGTLPPAPMD